MRVSVVVPTHRRPLLLRRCLAALLAQDFPKQDYEILVVDDGGDAETQRVVAARAGTSRVSLRYLRLSPRQGPAAARNRGWRAACADIVAFTDDDTIPGRHWLAAGLAAFGPEVAGVWGRIVVPRPPVPTDYQREIGRLEQAECITANCFYRREALAAVGGFDERFKAAWREDTDLFFAILAHGGRIVRAERATVTHPVRATGWGVSLRLQRNSMYNALLYKKHPRLYRQRIQAAPPWRYYLIVLGLAAVVLGIVRGSLALAFAGGGLWALLTARFCLQRLRDTTRDPAHVVEMVLTSMLIPPLSVFWRLRGAIKYRVFFV